MARKYVDCRALPSESNCSLYISGTEEEVFQTALHHDITVHGHADSPEFREEVLASLRDDVLTAEVVTS